MYTVLIFVHASIAVLLIAVILLQTGRSGGLTESFGAAAESIFGTKTNVFMVRLTTTLAILFITSCLVLAYLSKQQSKSLMEQAVVVEKDEGQEEKEQLAEEGPLGVEDTVKVSADEDISSEQVPVPDAANSP